jgi:hypothetical protein
LAEIFVQCPTTGTPISTGLKTEWVLLTSLPCIALPLRCPVCSQVHHWHPQDAWIGPAMPSHTGNFLGASRPASVATFARNEGKIPRRD